MSESIDKLSGKIDRSARTPIYLQLAAILRDYVAARPQQSSPIPSEREIAGHFGLARMTVRQAIDTLVSAEVLDRVVGLGTFVHRPKVDLQVKLTSYSEEMQRRGMVPDAKVLDFELVPAGASIARELQLHEGQLVVRFRRLLLADGEPMSVDENFIPVTGFPGSPMTRRPPPCTTYWGSGTAW